MTGTFRENICTFVITARCIIIKIINNSTNIVEKIKTHVIFSNLLGVFAKLQEATTSFVMHIRLSVWLSTRFHWPDFD
jgi:hypothetical protein